METAIKVVEGCFEIEITNKVSLEWRNKFHAAINRRRIINWCNDHHIDSMIIVKEGQFFLSIKHKTPECKPCTISDLGNTFEQLVDFVNDLPEVDSTIEDDNKSKEQSQEEIVDFVTDVLVGLHKKEINGAILMTFVGPIGLPCGKISHEVLTQMFETWLDKYGNK